MNRSRRWRQFLPTTTLGAGAALLAVVVVASLWLVDGTVDADPGTGFFRPTAKVTEGPFAILVTETATLDARQSVTLASDLPSNSAKILFLAAEGAALAKGDVVARFDPSPFEEEIHKLQSDLQEASAILQQAEAELELIRVDSEARLDRLGQQVEDARVKLDNLEQADLPIKEATARKQLQQAEADHDRAVREVTAMEELVAQQLARPADLDNARGEAEKKALDLVIAQRNFANLTQAAMPSELRQAKLALELNTRELDNFRAVVSKQKIIKQNADVARYHSRLADLEQALAQARKHLGQTTLHAPVPGQLLYQKISIANDKRRVQVGDSLWHRQGFAVIPDLSAMIAEVQVRESEVGLLAPGQTVSVHPEAYPSLNLSGRLESIGTLAAGQGSTDNHFVVRIAIDNPDPRLRPGMTARAAILARHYDTALRIPVAGVFYQDRQALCYLWQSGKPRAVAVTLGESDGRHVMVESGLEAGQEILLVHPDSLGG